MALYAVHYNFCRIHKTLRVTPAMEAGLTNKVMSLEDLVGVLEAEERAVIGTERNKRGGYKQWRADFV